MLKGEFCLFSSRKEPKLLLGRRNSSFLASMHFLLCMLKLLEIHNPFKDLIFNNFIDLSCLSHGERCIFSTLLGT